MLPKILLVDDHEPVLRSLQRGLRESFDAEIALGGAAGLAALERNSYQVVVSDLQMPHMDGHQFLKRVRDLRPEVVRFMLTGHADLDAAMQAVNEGHVFQFLTKPCPLETLHRALDAGVRQHRLLMAERDLLEQTLGGAIALMGDLLSLINPVAFGEGKRIRDCVRHMATNLRLPNLWEYDLAAMLSRVGLAAVPASILDKLRCGIPLAKSDERALLAEAQAAHTMLSSIPRLEVVAEIVHHQGVPYSQLQDAQVSETVRRGGQMLMIAAQLDKALAAGWLKEVAIANMLENPAIYDPLLVSQLHTYSPGPPPAPPHCFHAQPAPVTLVTL